MITITNKADVLNISITGGVGSLYKNGYTLDKLIAETKDWVNDIVVDLSTLGGDSFESIAIHDYLKTLPGKVTTRVIGRTASAGATIFAAGDEREISKNSGLLIHRGGTRTEGNVDDHEQSIQTLTEHDNLITSIYQSVTGKRKALIESQMKKERFMTAEEAIEWGFATKIIETKQNPILNQAEMDTTKIKELLNVAEDDAIQTAIETMQAENTRLAGIVNQVEADKDAAKELEITNYIDAAVTDGKIADEVKDKYITLAKTDFEAVKMVIEAAKPAPLKNHIEDTDPEKIEMTKAEALKIRNSKKSLQRWFDENPEEYTKVMNTLKSK